MRTVLTAKITIHFVKNTKHLNDEDFGITLKNGRHFIIYIRANGEFYETLWHELAHSTQELIGNKFEDEELPILIEDFIRNYLRKKAGVLRNEKNNKTSNESD